MTLNPTTFVNALRLYIPPEFGKILPASPCLNPCEFEPQCFRALTAVVKPGATIYDVGASFGIVTAMIATLAGENGQVIAFEPNVEAMALAKLLLAENQLLHRVHHVNALVGECSTGAVPFFFVPGLKSVASTRNSDIQVFHPNAVRTELNMIALDDFEGPVPSVIKVDIEGSEFQFLRGARQLLERHRPDLVIETHGLEINGIAGNVRELCQAVEEIGYQLWDLTANARTRSDEFAQRYAETFGHLLASTRLDGISGRLNRGY